MNMKYVVLFCAAAFVVAAVVSSDRTTLPPVVKVAESEPAPVAESKPVPVPVPVPAPAVKVAESDPAAAPAPAPAKPDQDTTPVTQCENLPPSVSIDVFSWSKTTKVCREMLRVLDGVRHQDITMFEKVAALLKFSGYEKDDIQIIRELVEIVRLRGLYNKPDRWYGTIDVIWRSWSAFNGAVSPADVISLLRGAGGAAKTISDSGLTTAIIMMKQQHQRGE
jgi:hypothetical protein